MNTHSPRLDQVNQALNMIRPAMEADGGGIETFEIVGDIVKVKLKGACLFCPSYQLTLKLGIEKTLKQKLEWVEKVETL